jgi:hypothetical protein
MEVEERDARGASLDVVEAEVSGGAAAPHPSSCRRSLATAVSARRRRGQARESRDEVG